MAIYRQLHTTFWKDDFIGECNQLQKLFFLYLLSNDRSAQSGVYEFSYRYACFELDITKQEITALLNHFIQYEKIRFNPENNELLIVNWLKYNKSASPKVAAVIDRELKELRTVEFKSEVVTNCLRLRYPIGTTLEDITDGNRVSIPYPYSIDTLSVPYGYDRDRVSIGYPESEIGYLKRNLPIDTISQPTEEPTKEPTEEPAVAVAEKKQTQDKGSTVTESKALAATAANTSQTAFSFYQNNFGPLPPIVMESIAYWLKDVGEDLVLEAMRRAALEQKGFRYAEGIMKSWDSRNIKDLEAVHADDVAHDRKSRGRAQSGNKKIETMPVWDVPAEETPLSEAEENDIKEQLKMIQELRPK